MATKNFYKNCTWKHDNTEHTVYKYAVECYRVVDGDTVECLLDKGLEDFSVTKIRLNDVDTPETYFAEGLEKEAGVVATEWTKWWLDNAKGLLCITTNYDKNGGRVAGDFINENGIRLSEFLVLNGVAIPTEGKQHDWSEEELKIIIENRIV